MIRLLVYLVLVVLAALGAAWFADNPGRIGVDWLGYRAETSVAALAFLLVMLFFAGVFLQRLATLIARDLPFSKEKRQKRRSEKGYAALNAAMVALSAGDKKAAKSLTGRATRLLPPQPLTHIMAAEAARLADDHETAKEHFQALLDDDQAAFLGLRGLIGEARIEGREQDALELAGRAVALRPKSHWALQTLFDLHLKAGDWQSALDDLSKLTKAGVTNKAQAATDRAALLYCRAVEADLAGQADTARTLALDAANADPALSPAVAMAARLLIAAGKNRDADKLLRAGWKKNPQPLLLDMWHALSPNEPAHARLKRVEHLVAVNPTALESHLALARAALDSDNPALARPAIEQALKTKDRRAFMLRAELAEQDKDSKLAQSFRERAVLEAIVAQWQCRHCGSRRGRWTPHCPGCGRFNTQHWQRGALDSPAALGTKTRPLGLIGGSSDPQIPRDGVAGEPFHS